MKKLNKFLALLLSATTLSTVCLSVACKEEETETTEIEIDWELRETYDGTHVYDAVDTETDFIKDGRCNYVVVVPENAATLELTAAEEFVELFRTATDIKLNIISDTGLTHDVNNRYISIGKTTLAAATTNLVGEKADLGLDGCRVVTVDKSIYLYGGGDTGTLYAVYDFMSVTFGFEQYYLDCMEIQTGVKNLKLKNYQIIDIPDFEHRGGNNTIWLNESDVFTENAYANRLRIKGSRGASFMPIHKEYNTYASGRGSTNSLTYLPMDTYKNLEKPETYHPDWFSDMGNELCYTAHGNEVEFELMLEECAKKIENSLMLYTPEEYPLYTGVTLTQQDNSEYCTCETCFDLSLEYGGIVGVYIVFMNKLAERVNAWMELPENAMYKRENFTYYFFAYQYTVDAPAKWDPETKTYVPNHPDIAIHEDVGVYLACSQIDSQISFWADESKSARENVEKWTALSDNVIYWYYATNFRNFMWMYESFNFFYDGFFAWNANRSNKMMFMQSQEPTKGTQTGWHNLKNYLDAKLMWDTSLNVETLTTNYFDAMYGPASDHMLSLFYDMRIYMTKVIVEQEDMHGAGDARPSLEKKQYWPFNLVEQWLKKLDEAKEIVAYLEPIDPEGYEKICQHIEAESISVLYIILTCHSSTLTAAQKQAYIDRLYYDIEWMGLEEMSIGHSAGDTILLWLNNLK
ncbi:MAG: DUF4838 domain-containing protein [Clostridia bacterium]|nr:DUF4838 domain-containing protein [Clostridia bacterium]